MTFVRNQEMCTLRSNKTNIDQGGGLWLARKNYFASLHVRLSYSDIELTARANI